MAKRQKPQIGYLDMEFPPEDRKQLGKLAVSFFDEFAQLVRAKKADQAIDLVQGTLLHAYSLGAVRAHIGSTSVRTEGRSC